MRIVSSPGKSLMPIHSLFGLALAGLFALASSPVPAATSITESRAMHAEGTFDVKTIGQKADNPDAEAGGFARIALDKQYHGAIEGTGNGEMLASGDGVKSGAYVALEKISGSLDGRHGSFVLMHHAVMVDGAPRDWRVTVVPDSGTDALVGIGGELRILIANGKHSYDFEYSLP
jgi:opacity protein-like surface antigen